MSKVERPANRHLHRRSSSEKGSKVNMVAGELEGLHITEDARSGRRWKMFVVWLISGLGPLATSREGRTEVAQQLMSTRIRIGHAGEHLTLRIITVVDASFSPIERRIVQTASDPVDW